MTTDAFKPQRDRFLADNRLVLQRITDMVARFSAYGSGTHMRTSTYSPGQLLTFTAAAREMGVSRSTLYALVKSGELPTVAVNRSRRIDRKAIERYIASHTQS